MTAINLIPSIKDLQETLKMYRENGLHNDIVSEIKTSTTEYEREAVIKYRFYSDSKDTEEFINLRLGDQESYRDYTFFNIPDQLKQMKNAMKDFFKSGELPIID